MSSEVKVEPHAVTVQQFFFRDGEKNIPAGELLGALLTLTDSKKPIDNLDVSEQVVDYLKENDYITCRDGEYDVTNRQRMRCHDLGNRVSKMMDEQLSQLPIGTEVKLPQILVTQEPHPNITSVYEPLKQP